MKKLLIAALITTVLAAMAISMTGCNKSVAEPPRYYQTPLEVADYLGFPVGSFFIYKDSVTGSFDSITVTESDRRKLFRPSHLGRNLLGAYTVPDYYYDSLGFRMALQTSSGAVDWLRISHVELGSDPNRYYGYDQRGYEALVFVYPVTEDWKNTSDDGVFLIPSMTVEGIIYNNVYRVLDSQGVASPTTYYSVDYYWAKGVGVIKKIYKTNTETHSWTLVRKG
jgi:hypothetical protein